MLQLKIQGTQADWSVREKVMAVHALLLQVNHSASIKKLLDKKHTWLVGSLVIQGW